MLLLEFLARFSIPVIYNYLVELFLRVVQGAYAYLLICLILIVTGLFLSLLWLIVKRTKEAGTFALAGATLDGPVVTAPVDAILPQIDTAELESLHKENQKLKDKVQVLEEEIKNSGSAGDRAKELNDKVQYLESKLLEYEILQEEIGNLSTLKIENEQLKQKLVESGLSLSDTGSGVAEALAAPAPAPENPANFSETASKPMVVNTPAEITEAPQSKSGEAADLDALLAEIDKLTGDKSSST